MENLGVSTAIIHFSNKIYTIYLFFPSNQQESWPSLY
uniref:Uncharacterized protein n=1 Tax=Arundo donax TaxID=35708 RepID=A0A0A9EKE0_ARUDO